MNLISSVHEHYNGVTMIDGTSWDCITRVSSRWSLNGNKEISETHYFAVRLLDDSDVIEVKIDEREFNRIHNFETYERTLWK